jgi:outer membrane protein TolC
LYLLVLGLLPLIPVYGRAATLAEAVTAALGIEQQASRVTALRAEGDATRRQASSLIAGDLALRVKTVTDAATGDAGAYELEAMLDVPLWMPGQRGARQAVAQAMGAQADALVRLLRWEMAGRVREVTWAAALAQGRLRQAGAALDSAKSLERDTDKRVRAGELARVDLLVAQQETLAREVDIQAAQFDFDRAIQTYVDLTGLPALPEPLEERPEPRVSALAETAAELPADHPLLADTDSAVAQARAERGRVQTDRHGNPVLSLGGKRVRDGRDAISADALQLEVSIPFGLAGQSAPALARAERGYTERVTERQRSRLAAEQTLHDARLEVLGGADALAVAQRRQSVTQEAAALVRRAFDLGEAELTALLQAQERVRQASLHLELRRLEQGRAAARLNQALGVVPQ